MAEVRFGSILLKKSFGGRGRNFLEPLMRFVRSDVRGHVASRKNDHGLSHRRWGASQRWSCPKISICEIFGIVRFSTFSTPSVNFGRQLASAQCRLCPQERTSSARPAMSEKCQQRKWPASLDHLVGAEQDGSWHVKSE